MHFGKTITTAMAILASVAFVSGVFLAGLLGWWLLRTLRVAGVIGAHAQNSFVVERPTARPRFAVLGAAIVLAGSAIYLALARADARAAAEPERADASPVTLQCRDDSL